MEIPYEQITTSSQMEAIQQVQQPQMPQNEIDHIMSKKKEAYRIEIRKRKMNSTFQLSRERTYLKNLGNPQQQQQYQTFVPLLTEFSSTKEVVIYFQSVLNNLKVTIDQMVLQTMPISTEQVDNTLKIVNGIIDLLTNEEEGSSDINRCCEMLKLGICKVLRPLIMDIRFKEFVYLQNNVYNLYGTLMYVDTKNFEEQLDDELICLFMNSIVSDQAIIIEQGLFLIGNLMIGNLRTKKKLYELEIVESLFQIHKFDRLNPDKHGEQFWHKIQDLPWVISILIDRTETKSKDLEIVNKDVNFIQFVEEAGIFYEQKRLIEICFDLLSLDGMYDPKRIKLAQAVSKLLGDLIYTTDALIDFFFDLCSLKHVDMIARLMSIMEAGLKGEADMVLFQNVSHIMFNFLTGQDQYVMRFVRDGFLDLLLAMYQSPFLKSYSYFLSEILWALSNISSINSKMVELIISNQSFLSIIDQFAVYPVHQRRELTYVLINVMVVGTHKQLRWLINHNVMNDLLQSLLVAEPKVVLSILDGLNTMLASFSGIFTADGENVIIADLERYKFSQYLNRLQQSKNDAVYHKVTSLIQKHYNYE